ncbi:MAG TPA: hypothetical protein VGC76_15495 [Pyrinomonadaceae bacterium]|jgi:hypothetical protein
MSGKIQNLLEQANYSVTEDSSVNLAKRVFPDETEAKAFFKQTREKLLNIDEWNKNSTPSNYELFDDAGRLCERKILDTGKFIRITVKASGKHDWVKILNVYEAAGEFVITVSPSYDPTENPPDKTVTSHFFKSEATNNFCLQKDDKSVALYVIGLNEKANVKETDNLIEAARNLAAANFGYYLGLQKAMWKEFCARFLEIEEN